MGWRMIFASAVCGAFAVAAHAAPLLLVRKGDISVFFLSNSAKQVTATIRSGQDILNYDKPRFDLDANFNDDPSTLHLSVVETHYADCTSGTIATGGMESHAGPMGAGGVVTQFPEKGLPPPNFFEPLSLSDYDNITRPIFDAICGH